MPYFTVETTYRLPVYRRRVYEAFSVEAACHLAIEDQGWEDGRDDVDTSGDTYVTGAWEGDEADAGPSIPIPERFGELVQRRVDLFDTLLALLKEPAQPMGLSRHDFERWLPRALAAIGRAEATTAAKDVQPERS